MIKQILLVGLGGATGSILRYLTTMLTEKYYTHPFPLATLIINILGCFIIGLLMVFFEQHAPASSHLKFLLITGFCGGYTTFSVFASENIVLLQHNNYTSALLYIASSVCIGLAAVWLGLICTK